MKFIILTYCIVVCGFSIIVASYFLCQNSFMILPRVVPHITSAL